MRNNPARDIPHYISVLQEFLGARMYLIFALILVAAIAEGFGILMLLPLLQGLDAPGNIPANTVTQNDGTSEATDDSTGITAIMHELLASLGVADSVVAVLLLITTAFIAKGLITFSALGFDAYLRGKLLRELRGRLFDHYSHMSYGYYASRDTGHFINLINDQVNRALHAFRSLSVLGAQIVNAIIYLGLAFIVAWRFGIMALVLGITLLALFRWLNNFVRELSRKTASETGHLAKLLIQTLHAFKYLTATAKIAPLRSTVMASIDRLTAYQVRTGIASGFTQAVREPIAVVFIMLIVLVQLIFLHQPLAPILVSILLFYRALNAVLGMQGNWQIALEYIGSLEMVRDEFLAQRQNHEADGSFPVSCLSQGILFDHVFFSYNPKHDEVLKDVSLSIPVRTTVALIGESGAGKSTLVDLLTLLLKPQKGKIYIDGVASEQVLLASWRQQIGYVSQETVVFDDTIANNICLWEGDILNDHLLLERVRNAARQAHIAQFIETLPEGYLSLVGDRGLRLSGGQRQRLFIARELFRNPNMLILDEATSALDTESERAIQKSIDALKGHITVVIIAHRLSTIRNVDHVYVFDKGRLIEQGPYQVLRDDVHSRFGKLVALQTL